MKKILILALIGCSFIACKNDDDNDIPHNCDFETIVSAEQFQNAPSDQLTINSIEIEDHCLTINFTSSGCDGNSWEFDLIDADEIMESEPPQRNLRLSLKNEELCDAVITKEATFHLSNLQVDGGRVILNITNSSESILYEY